MLRYLIFVRLPHSCYVISFINHTVMIPKSSVVHAFFTYIYVNSTPSITLIPPHGHHSSVLGSTFWQRRLHLLLLIEPFSRLHGQYVRLLLAAALLVASC